MDEECDWLVFENNWTSLCASCRSSLSPQKVVASKKRPYAVLESSSATKNNNNSRVAAAKKPSSSGNVAFLRHCVDKVFPAYSPTPAVLQPQLAAKSEHPARRMALPPAPPPQVEFSYVELISDLAAAQNFSAISLAIQISGN